MNLSRLSEFRGIFEKIGIDWGCDLLTDSTTDAPLQSLHDSVYVADKKKYN